MKKIRCGLIGCGRIGCGFDDKQKGKNVITHAGSYFKNKNTELVALCDIDLLKLKKYGKKYHVDGLFTNSTNMFKNTKLDCVSICTLVDSHLYFVKEAVKFGIKGIFLEKPISYDIQTTKKIIELCKSRNIILVLNHQRRFDPYYHELKKFIHHKLGQIQLVDVYYGGGIANTGSHLFDLIRYFFGESISIYGKYSKNKSNNNHDPNIDAIIQLKNGLICNLHAIDFQKYVNFEMLIMGSLGKLRINLIANTYDAEYFKAIKIDSSGTKTLKKSPISFKKPKKSSIYIGVENLVDCIKSKKTPLSTGKDGLKSLELILASIQSCKQNKLIQIPFSNNKYKINSK